MSLLKRLLFALFLTTTIGQVFGQTCREVIGYYPNWQWYDRAKLVDPMSIFYEKYTILNYSFFKPETTGAISSTDTWADENLLLGEINWQTSPPSYFPNTSIPSRAHLVGTKVLASIGGWTLSDNFPQIAASAAKRATFAHGCNLLCGQYDFDGIDIDWEYPGFAEHGGGPADSINFTLLLAQIRDSLTVFGTAHGKTMFLTACAGASETNMSFIQWPQVMAELDFVNLMSYDFFGSWDPITNHNAPLFAPAQGEPTFNINSAITKLTGFYGVPAAKINAGLAFYGRSIKTVGAPILHGPQTANVDNVTFPDDLGTPLYYNVLPKLPLFSEQYDVTAQVPYLLGINGLNTFLSYDNKNSIANKANYIKTQNLAGTIIWEITGDYIETYPGSGVIAGTPLLDTLNTVFCEEAPPATCPTPANLGATDIGLNSALLFWDKVSEATTYSLQWRTLGATNWTTEPDMTSNSHELTGLACGNTYQFRVKSNCETESGSFSAAANFSTATCPCDVPAGLAATPAATAILVNWGSVPGAISYTLQWKISTAPDYVAVPNLPTNSHNLTGLICGATYLFKVKSVCNGIESAYSDKISATTVACPCTVPANPATANIGASSANLTWSNTGATSYQLQYKLATATNWATVANIPSSPFLLQNLACGKTYNWKVRSICGTKKSAFSATINFTTLGCNTTCALPTNLANSAVTATGATLGWTAVSGAISYEIQWKTTVSTTWTTISGLTGNSFSLQNLTACTNYSWKIKTVCTGGASAFSAEKALSTIGCTGCGVPTALVASPISGTSATLGWAAVPGAISYEIQWKLATATAWATVAAVPSNSHNLTGLATCTGYFFRVKTNCAGAAGAFSHQFDFSTTGCSGNCQAAPSYYFAPANYAPIGEIKLGQGRLWPVWGTSVDAHIPQNRVSWAMADVHAAHLFRSVLGTDKIPANFYHATAGKESFCGCDQNIVAAPPGSNFPYSYQPASVGDGCFQIENNSAYNELIGLFPQRFPTGQHINLVAGKHYQTASIAKACYDIFAVKWWAVSKGWQPVEFFNQAADPNAARKLIAVAYNRGLWYHALDTVLHFDRPNAIASANISPYFLSNSYGYDYQNALTNYTLLLNNQAAQLPSNLTATNPATGQPYNYFDNFYDPQVTWANVNEYIDSIGPLYPAVNFAVVKSAVQTKFNSVNGGNSVSFRFQLGPVLDELILKLPADDPTNYIAANYGCAAPPPPPPPSCTTTGNLVSSNITSNSANLAWNPVSAATGYNVRYRVVGNSSWVSTSSATASASISGLTVCSNYEWQVQSVCTIGTSIWTASATFSTIGCSCPTPTNLTTSAITPTGATLNWAAAAGAISYEIQWKLASASNWTTVSGITATTYPLQNLTTCIPYLWKIKTVCAAGATSGFSAEIAFSTIGCGAPPPAPTNYCSSFSLNSTAEFIQSITVGSLTNTSGNNSGFGNFINLSTNLVHGATVAVSLTPGFVGAAQTEFWRLWIDWNRDGDFADAGEILVDGQTTTAAPLVSSFVVPSSASVGYTRMRISMKRTAPAEVCDVFSNGEVEDYLGLISVNFAGGAGHSLVRPNGGTAVVFAEKKPIFARTSNVLDVFPNPGTSEITVQFDLTRPADVAVELLDFQGRLVRSRPLGLLDAGLFSEKISGLEVLSAGVYFLILRADGAEVQARRWVKI